MLVVLVIVTVSLGLFYTSDLIVPGVEALGVDLGGKTTDQAVNLLLQEWQRRVIVLDAGDTTWSVAPTMVGIMLDAEATAQAAHRQGRSLGALADGLRGGDSLDVAPVWRVDTAIARSNLEALAPRLEVASVDAGLQLVAGRVEASRPVAGRSLNVTVTADWLEQHVDQVVERGRLDLVLVPVQPAITDVSPAVAQANQLLNNRLSIQVYDPVTHETIAWAVGPEAWSAWLSLSVHPLDPTRLQWEIDTEKARAFLADDQATMLGPDRYLDLDRLTAGVEAVITAQKPDVYARVFHRGRQHTVQTGETLSSLARHYGMPYPWIQQANPGLADALSVGQIITIPSPDVLLPLPVVENKRIVVSLSQQRMWAYEDSALKWDWPVSTGIESSPTAPGVFQVQTHEPNAYASNWNLWMPYFVGIYRPLPGSDFMNGFHGFPTRDGSALLWTGDLGHPVTYGCLLISTENATALYHWAETGVVVEIRE